MSLVPQPPVLALLLRKVREVRLRGPWDPDSVPSLSLASGLACLVSFGNALVNKVNTAV